MGQLGELRLDGGRLLLLLLRRRCRPPVRVRSGRGPVGHSRPIRRRASFPLLHGRQRDALRRELALSGDAVDRRVITDVVVGGVVVGHGALVGGRVDGVGAGDGASTGRRRLGLHVAVSVVRVGVGFWFEIRKNDGGERVVESLPCAMLDRRGRGRWRADGREVGDGGRDEFGRGRGERVGVGGQEEGGERTSGQSPVCQVPLRRDDQSGLERRSVGRHRRWGCLWGYQSNESGGWQLFGLGKAFGT